MELESVVIVRRPKGWVAHIRYSDKRRNLDLASTSRHVILALIDNNVRSNTQ